MRFLFGLLEVQVRLVVGMLGALLAGEQTFNRQQLHAGKLSARSILLKSNAGGVGDHFSGWLFQREEQSDLSSFAFADVV